MRPVSTRWPVTSLISNLLKKTGNFPVFYSIFVEREGVISIRPGISRFSGCHSNCPRADAWVTLSDPTIAGEFQMARLSGDGLDDKSKVVSWIALILKF
jgi:hypothetical protein